MMIHQTEFLKYDWKFMLIPEGDAPAGCQDAAFDDSAWETVRVPHDWAANGVFDADNDASSREVAADGFTTAIKHSGRTGGLPIVGLGVYRKWVKVPADAEFVAVDFDGVMWEADVYVNGKHAFFNHFGYKSFRVDMTPYVTPGEDALIAVFARVYPDCSRWYPGAGIFRNVRFTVRGKTHFAFNGIWVRPLEVGEGHAAFDISADAEGDAASIAVEIIRPDGEPAGFARSRWVNAKTPLTQKDFSGLSLLRDILDPVLWSIETPNLYTARVTLYDSEGVACDEEEVRFGIRTAEFFPDRGFVLNGKQVKMNGVCNHHDLGSLGAAVNVAALRRQLRLMKEMGVNAIRTSHNPPAPELLNLCDEMGFVVMDEMYDEWYTPKVENGYAKYFREHAARDEEDVIRRDRNHPCVVLWSIGNEILEQDDPEGWRAAKLLADTARRVDPTRKTTAGFNNPFGAFENHLADYVDVVGTNYKPYYYAEFHKAHPNWCFVGTETESCVSTRGVYRFPAEVEIPAKRWDDLAVSAYELAAPPWAYYPEREWKAQDDCPFYAGEFVWTGMDYLGEPTPYYDEWPSRSSYFGVVDLAGLPKNRFWGYRAQWTNEPVLHVFPHWNWEGREGEVTPVHVYTSYPSAELFINGKSQGVQIKNGTHTEIGRYRLMWNNVTYEPGEVKVVAYDASGAPAAEAVVKTAGAPAKLVLTADRAEIESDGDDLVYITCAVTDAEGNVCPLADNRVTFTGTGAGEFLTTDSGDQREVESFARPDKKVLAGYTVACFRSLIGVAGELTVRAEAEGLEGCEITVTVQ